MRVCSAQISPQQLAGFKFSGALCLQSTGSLSSASTFSLQVDQCKLFPKSGLQHHPNISGNKHKSVHPFHQLVSNFTEPNSPGCLLKCRFLGLIPEISFICLDWSLGICIIKPAHPLPPSGSVAGGPHLCSFQVTDQTTEGNPLWLLPDTPSPEPSESTSLLWGPH